MDLFHPIFGDILRRTVLLVGDCARFWGHIRDSFEDIHAVVDAQITSAV